MSPTALHLQTGKANMIKIDLAGQTAIVTGGAQGIGFAVAHRLIASGANVCLWDINESAVAKAVEILGEQAQGMAINITDLDAMSAAHATLEKECGPVSILVNSAGIAGANEPLAEYDPDTWRQVIDINLNGTFYLNKVVVPSMIKHNYGRIVNIASVAGKEGNPNAAAYSASKGGVIALTKSLGKETAGFNIAVNCITPAAARTPIFDQMSQEHIDYMLSKIPRGRFLEVEEVANMVSWLVSAENSFTTASTFDLSGGRATY